MDLLPRWLHSHGRTGGGAVWSSAGATGWGASVSFHIVSHHCWAQWPQGGQTSCMAAGVPQSIMWRLSGVWWLKSELSQHQFCPVVLIKAGHRAAQIQEEGTRKGHDYLDVWIIEDHQKVSSPQSHLPQKAGEGIKCLYESIVLAQSWETLLYWEVEQWSVKSRESSQTAGVPPFTSNVIWDKLLNPYEPQSPHL